MNQIYIFLSPLEMAESSELTEEAKTSTKSEDKSEDVNPWAVTGNVNGNDMYDRLIVQFGCEPITEALKTRFERVTKHPLHTWMRRGLFFAHRELNSILDDYEKGIPIYLYTGRGPTSESLHIGHVIAMQFCQWLQQVFNAYVVFQIADDEKYYFKDDLSYEQILRYAKENSKDLAAFGFDPKKTYIFYNRDSSRNLEYQRLAADFKKTVCVKHLRALFGLDENSSIGQIEWPIWQTVPAFSEAFGNFRLSSKFSTINPSFAADQKLRPRCLIVYAIDQDPYFRLARELAAKFDLDKPCSIMCRFLPSIEGNSKMSSSVASEAGKGSVDTKPKTIFLTSTPKEIKDLINRHGFSGGGDTLELHRKLGGNPDVDVPYQLLRYFLDDDTELSELYQNYKSGALSSGEMKKRCIQVITEYVENHKIKRALVTDKMMEDYYVF